MIHPNLGKLLLYFFTIFPLAQYTWPNRKYIFWRSARGLPPCQRQPFICLKFLFGEWLFQVGKQKEKKKVLKVKSREKVDEVTVHDLIRNFRENYKGVSRRGRSLHFIKWRKYRLPLKCYSRRKITFREGNFGFFRLTTHHLIVPKHGFKSNPPFINPQFVERLVLSHYYIYCHICHSHNTDIF